MTINDQLETSQHRLHHAIGDLQSMARGIGPHETLDAEHRELAAETLDQLADTAEAAARDVPETTIVRAEFETAADSWGRKR